MKVQEAAGVSCLGCSGTCCTYEANSMMVTPVEAWDLFQYLTENNLLSEELKVKCEETVKKFRLDQMVSTGKRSFLRRTYTCPFFNHTELGCPLPREVKPYGCLAFNTHHEVIKTAEFCFSDRELLQDREKLDALEKDMNEKIALEFGLSWEKTPLPIALLDFWKKK